MDKSIDVVPMGLPGMASQAFYATWTDSRSPSGDVPVVCVSERFNAMPQHTYGVVVP